MDHWNIATWQNFAQKKTLMHLYEFTINHIFFGFISSLLVHAIHFICNVVMIIYSILLLFQYLF
jgi:hypothetical protein